MTMITEWAPAVITSVADLTTEIREIRLKPFGGVVLYPHGSHVEVEILVGSRTETRCYSLVGLPHEGAYRIAVKYTPEGRGGSRAMWQLASGDQISISRPKCDFMLSLDRPDYLLIAGGIGITPLLGMGAALKQRQASFRLVYAAKRRDDIAFAPELDQYLGASWRPALSAEGGRLDVLSTLESLHPDGEAYVCGPISLLDAVKAAWAQLGRPLERLRFESFASSGHFSSVPFQIELPRIDLRIDVGSQETMIDALMRSGIDVMSDCLRGECGLCALPVLRATGPIDHRDVFLSDTERHEDSRICACVSRVAGGTIVIDDGYRERHDIL